MSDVQTLVMQLVVIAVLAVVFLTVFLYARKLRRSRGNPRRRIINRYRDRMLDELEERSRKPEDKKIPK